MGVYVFTQKEAALKTVFPKNASYLSSALSKHAPEDGDISYMDISGLAGEELKKALAQIKKCCKDTPWGIIDPKGSVSDPAALFFEGASDYVGPSFFKTPKAMEPKRLKEVLQWRNNLAGSNVGSAKGDVKATKGAGLPKTGIKLPPASTFPGWKSMQAGKTMPFYLLYCCLHGKIALDTRLGEKVYAQIHQRFLSYLHTNFLEAEGLVWMDSGKDCLILLPPKAKSAEAAVKACVRMLVSAPIMAMEALALTVPADLVFALHYGSLSYSPPGRTGTVVSDAVNFIFHLGAKKAEPGRLTLSSELPDATVPAALEDCFVPAGEFEDRNIWHTKKIRYAKS